MGEEQRIARNIAGFRSRQEQEEEIRQYWREKSIAEKMAETASLIRYAYALQGIDVDAQRPERTLVRVQRERR